MKFIILGSTELAFSFVTALLECKAEVILLGKKGYVDIKPFAEKTKIAFKVVSDINKEIIYLKMHSPDYILYAWPDLISAEILKIPKMSIGTHPTRLPQNRGCHPLQWLVALGIKETALTFFEMDEGIDTGNILLQVPFKVGKTLITTKLFMAQAGYEGIKTLCRILPCQGTPQGEGNTWRKRNKCDSVIDMRMSVEAILKTVRAYQSYVYVGEYIEIIDAWPVSAPENIEHGKVLNVMGNTLTVKVDGGAIKLVCKSLPKLGKYIYPPFKYFI